MYPRRESLSARAGALILDARTKAGTTSGVRYKELITAGRTETKGTTDQEPGPLPAGGLRAGTSYNKAGCASADDEWVKPRRHCRSFFLLRARQEIGEPFPIDNAESARPSFSAPVWGVFR